MATSVDASRYQTSSVIQPSGKSYEMNTSEVICRGTFLTLYIYSILILYSNSEIHFLMLSRSSLHHSENMKEYKNFYLPCDRTGITSLAIPPV